MSILFERAYPYLFGIMAGSLWFVSPQPFDKVDILNASLNIGAILTGFLATCKAILMTANLSKLDEIRNTTYINDLTAYLAQGIISCFVFCLFSLTGYFVKKEALWYGVTWVTIGTISAFCFIRVTIIISKLLKYSQNSH